MQYFFDVIKKYYLKAYLRFRYPRLHVGTHFRYAPGFTLAHGQENVTIGHHCNLHDAYINAGSTKKIKIGDYVFFGRGVKLLARGHDATKYNEKRQTSLTEKPITIEDGVWIASGATVLGGVSIGKHAVVAAGAVVTKNVPAYTLVAGIPAQVKKKLSAPTRK